MAQTRGRRQAGNLLFYNGHRDRIVDVVGPAVWKYEHRPDILNATTVDPTGWTTTVVSAGTGDTEWDPNNEAGRLGTITPADNENDGGNYQLLGENFSCAGAHAFYIGMEAKSNDVDQIDLFFGAAIVDTDLLGAVTDAVYFESLDESSTVAIVAEKGSSETTGAVTATLTDDTDFILEMLFDGTRLKAYVDGVKIFDAVPANLPDTEPLRLSLHFLTGEAVVNTLNVKWLKAFQWAI